MRKNNGFTLIELIIVLAIISFVMVVNIQNENIQHKSEQGRDIALQVYQFSQAVKSHMSQNLDNADYINDGVTQHEGVDWLKSLSVCGGASPDFILPCDFSPTIGKTNITFFTEITHEPSINLLSSRIIIDLKDNDGNLLLDSESSSIAALTLRGGTNTDAIQMNNAEVQDAFNAENEGVTSFIITNSEQSVFYCPIEINVGDLNDNCYINAGVKEGGLIVITIDSNGSLDNLVRTDGANTLNNSLRFSNADEDKRSIEGVNRLYNMAGKALILGRSGVYTDSSWTPILGEGLVFDSDILGTGSLTFKGDIEADSDLLVDGAVFSDSRSYFKEGIVDFGSLEVHGNEYVLGNSTSNGDITVFGDVSSSSIISKTFLQSSEISATNSITSNIIVNAPLVRASSGLYSEGSAMISGDAITQGDSYVLGNRAIDGTTIVSQDIIANTGTAYLNNAFAGVIYDTDGEYMIDANNISRMNIIRSERIVNSTPRDELKISANKVVIARESLSCTEARQECATTVEGYIDVGNVMVKSPGDNRWVKFEDLLNGDDTYTGN